MKQFTLVLFVSCCSALFTGCAQYSITSNPPNANIIINGVDTGEVTPKSMYLCDLPYGLNSISVKKSGYDNPVPVDLDVKTSPGAIILSILFPPALIGELSGNFWRGSNDSLYKYFFLAPEVFNDDKELSAAKDAWNKALEKITQTKLQYRQGVLSEDEYDMFLKEDQNNLDLAHLKYMSIKNKYSQSTPNNTPINLGTKYLKQY